MIDIKTKVKQRDLSLFDYINLKIKIKLEIGEVNLHNFYFIHHGVIIGTITRSISSKLIGEPPKWLSKDTRTREDNETYYIEVISLSYLHSRIIATIEEYYNVYLLNRNEVGYYFDAPTNVNVIVQPVSDDYFFDYVEW